MSCVDWLSLHLIYGHVSLSHYIAILAFGILAFWFIVPLRHAVVSLTFVSVHAVRTCRGGRWGSPEFERVRCTVCFTCCCQRVSVHACMHFGVLLRHSCLTHFVSVHAARPCRGGRWGGPEFERVRCIVCFTCCCRRVSMHACMPCQSQLQFATTPWLLHVVNQARCIAGLATWLRRRCSKSLLQCT